MARYLGSTCKLCRREREKLFLKGLKCSTKCIMDAKRGKNPPGKQANARMKKPSEYSKRLREKQKARSIYGLTEQQFHHYFTRAEKLKGLTGENLLQLLEMRLDNVVYRLGIAPSRNMARQVVNHGNVLVNGKTVDLPGYPMKIKDTITIKDKIKNNIFILKSLEKTDTSPSWLKLDKQTITGSILTLPGKDQMSHPIDSQLIVELYSK
ncbi:MAG: 30S ribosomal protein S4 [Elusimicrobia bacterium]|nr:30S ribosomal protein S4 [Candidatus Liberimonas magnetica]